MIPDRMFLRVPPAALVLLLLAGPAAVAQVPSAADPEPGSSWEVNLHAATLFENLFNESGSTPQFGARIVRNTASGFSFGGNVDYAPLDDVGLTGFSGLSADLLLYSAEVDYRFVTSPRTRFFLGGGIGGATLSFGDAAPLATTSSTGLLVPAVAGIKILNRPVAPSWAIRIDWRDNLILQNTLAPGGGQSDELRNNWELSAGVSFLFGESAPPAVEPPAGPAPRQGAPADTDRDGVVDARDRCVNTPLGAAVDGEGCPVRPLVEDQPPVEDRPPPREPPVEDVPPAAPADTDRDGVVDADDRCVNTPRDAEVDERGCPVTPPVAAEPPAGQPAAGACVDGRGWFVAEESIPYDGRTFEPIGDPEPITEDNLEEVGSYDGVPIFVGTFSEPPYSDLWLPTCSEGTYQLYVEPEAP